MPVNTSKVAGRREVAYESLDDVLMDAEKLVANSNTRMLGNWTLGQMLAHLAASLHLSIDGPIIGRRGTSGWWDRFLNALCCAKCPPGFNFPSRWPTK